MKTQNVIFKISLKHFLVIIYTTLVYTSSIGQVQMKNWFLNNQRINMGSGTFTSTAMTNVSRMETNGMCDNSNNPVFYYETDPAGNLPPFYTSGIIFNGANTALCSFQAGPLQMGEVVICPSPCNSNEFYVFHTSAAPGSGWTNLLYAKVNLATSTYTTNNIICQFHGLYIGLALSKENSNHERILYVVAPEGEEVYPSHLGTGPTVYSLSISANGIIPTPPIWYPSAPTNVSSYAGLSNISEVDLSHDGTKLGWVSDDGSDAVLNIINTATGSQLNSIALDGIGVQMTASGGEFSPNGQKFFFSVRDITSATDYLGYVDLTQTFPSPQMIMGSNGYGLSQLELGYDGYIHATNGTNMIAIDPVTASITASVYTFPTPLISQPIYTLPDQIDGYNYSQIYISPSVTINQPILCAGQTTVLTATATTSSGQYTTYSWNTGATTSQIMINSGGTYTVTITDQSGCTASASRVITQSPAPIIAPLTTESTSRCTQQGNITLTASPGTGNQAIFSNYLWSGTGLTPPLNQASVVATTQTANTTYTVTVTSNSGCTATQSVVINWTTTCCPGSTITCGGTNRSLTYNNVNISQIYSDVCGTGNVIDLSSFGTDKRIAISGTLTINGNFTFRNCTYTSTSPSTSGGVTFGQNAKISVPNGSTLTVNNSYLFACSSNQWVGIEVASGGTLITQSTTPTTGKPVIADANVAINGVSGSIGFINLNNTRFYRNYVGVNIPSASAYTGTINGCTFSYNATDPLQNYMLAPHANQRTAVGIFANNMTSWPWQINTPGSTANTFEKINNGIYAYRSNVWVNNNVFNYIWNYDNINASSGNAVYAISLTGSQNSIMVQTNSLGGTPAFNNCRCAVYLNNVYATVQNNYMLDDTTGIYATACPNTSLDFNTNTITNTYAGITFNNVNSSLVRTVRAYNNTITVNEPFSTAIFPNAAYPNSYGIGHFEVSNTSVTCADGSRNCRVLVEHNPIYNGRYGVYVNNAYGTRITDNTITQNNTISNTGIKAGIYVSGGNAPLITINHLSANGDTYDETAASSVPNRRNGVFITNTQSSELCNNDFDWVGYAMHFQANCSQTKLIQNTFNRSKYGVVLKYNGVTPTAFRYQGETNLSHGNSFTGPFNNPGNANGSFRTYTFNTNASIHPFRIYNNTNNATQPFPNGADIFGNEFQKGNSTSTNLWSCSTQPGGWKSLIINQGDVYTKEVAEGKADELVAEGFEESGAWMLEKDLFARLKDEPALLQSKPLYLDFYEAKDQTSIGDVSRYEDAALTITDTTLVKDSLSLDTQIQTVIDANNQIQATNDFELNRKWVNDLYLHSVAKGITTFSNAEKQALYNLAMQCPFAAGDAVYIARTLYNLVDHNAYFDDDEICSGAASYKKEQIAKQKAKLPLAVTVSPNPASNFVEISVTGEDAELQISIYNTLGELIGSGNFIKDAELSTADMPNGVYEVCIKKNNLLLQSARLVISK